MIAAMIKAAMARRERGLPLLTTGIMATFTMLLFVAAMASVVVGVFLTAGAYGWIALGVALLLTEWRVDAS
jgi:hypothetical protein